MSGLAPKKSLGQHFLVDDNILAVIARLAELGPDDVALEIGPGLGALTRVLADRCAHVHAVELDRRLEPHLRGIAAPPNVSLHWGDALRLDLSHASSPPRRSSSRTCPTTSRRRSSRRASTACRRSTCGA